MNPYSKMVQSLLIKRYMNIAEEYPHDEKEFAQVVSKLQRDYQNYNYFIGVEDNAFRRKIDQKFQVHWLEAFGFTNGFCGKRVKSEAGTFTMPNVIVNDDVHIGRHCIIGTGSILDRDCRIGDYANIGINAVLEKGATVGNCVHVGTRATVLEGVHIADDCVIAPGVIVSEDIPEAGTHFGLPCKKHGKLSKL